jgi:hypothetical protein
MPARLAVSEREATLVPESDARAEGVETASSVARLARATWLGVAPRDTRVSHPATRGNS